VSVKPNCSVSSGVILPFTTANDWRAFAPFNQGYFFPYARNR